MRNGIAIIPCPRSAKAKLTRNILLGVLNDSLMYTAPMTNRLPTKDKAVTTSITISVKISPFVMLPVPPGGEVVAAIEGKVMFILLVNILGENLKEFKKRWLSYDDLCSISKSCRLYFI